MRRGLVAELCRVFNAKRVAMLCAMSHRQVTVDGKVVLPEYDLRWPADQLAGRMARLHDRQARLYGASPRAILAEEESPPLQREVVIYEPEQMDIAARVSDERPRLFDDVPLHELPRS